MYVLYVCSSVCSFILCMFCMFLCMFSVRSSVCSFSRAPVDTLDQIVTRRQVNACSYSIVFNACFHTPTDIRKLEILWLKLVHLCVFFTSGERAILGGWGRTWSTSSHRKEKCVLCQLIKIHTDNSSRPLRKKRCFITSVSDGLKTSPNMPTSLFIGLSESENLLRTRCRDWLLAEWHNRTHREVREMVQVEKD